MKLASVANRAGNTVQIVGTEAYRTLRERVTTHLFVLMVKDEQVVANFGQDFSGPQARIDRPDACYYCYGIDPASNTVHLCPPMLCKDETEIEYEREKYEVAIRDGIIDLMVLQLDGYESIKVVRPSVRPKE